MGGGNGEKGYVRSSTLDYEKETFTGRTLLTWYRLLLTSSPNDETPPPFENILLQ